MFKISDMTEAHAQQEGVINNGSETVVNLVGGGTIRGGDEYVRVCDDDGRELMYWHQQEFEEDFETAMGNFLKLASLCVEAGTRPVEVRRWVVDADDDFGGVTSQEEVLQLAGKAVSKACLFDGTGYFEGADGKFYGVRAVAEIVEVPRSEVEDLVGDIDQWHADMNVDDRKPWERPDADRTYYVCGDESCEQKFMVAYSLAYSNGGCTECGGPVTPASEEDNARLNAEHLAENGAS